MSRERAPAPKLTQEETGSYMTLPKRKERSMAAAADSPGEQATRRSRRVLASRRGILLGSLCACCLPRVGVASEAFTMEEVGPGIFIRRGPHEEVTPENGDGIANIGFIVGRDSVLVTDS